MGTPIQASQWIANFDKMKKTILILTLAFTAVSICNAQKIEAKKVFGGYSFTQDGKPLSMKVMLQTLEPNQAAFDLMKKAQANNTLASIIGFAGGSLIGWPIGTAIGGGKPNWKLAGIGAGLVVIGIPISSTANKQAKQAIDLYNASPGSSTFQQPTPGLKLIASQDGIGLTMSF
jgi:hypothetical protein